MGSRWLVSSKVKSIVSSIPYDRISRNDLLLFSSTDEDQLEVIRSTFSSSFFWSTLQQYDLYELYGLPERIRIVDRGPPGLESVLLVSFNLEDWGDLKDGNHAVALHGTSASTGIAYYLRSIKYDRSLLGEDLFDYLSSLDYAEHVRQSLLESIHPFVIHPRAKVCRDFRNSIFSIFQFEIYSIPDDSGWIHLIGTIVPRSEDYNPLDVQQRT